MQYRCLQRKVSKETSGKSGNESACEKRTFIPNISTIMPGNGNVIKIKNILIAVVCEPQNTQLYVS